jgi:UDP-3-O-[3-hydroxymyristoyl] glucosamine N-acyltransferase
MNKKYELVKDDFIIYKGRKLYRIRALKEITYTSIKEGSLGGYIEGYHNLSQEGRCWISDSSKVYGNARIRDNAFVGSESEIFGNAVIKDSVQVGWDVKIYGNAVVMGKSEISDGSRIYGNAVVKDIAMIVGSANIYGNTSIEGGSLVRVGKFYDNVAIKNSTDISIPVECHNNTVISIAIEYPVS